MIFCQLITAYIISMAVEYFQSLLCTLYRKYIPDNYKHLKVVWVCISFDTNESTTIFYLRRDDLTDSHYRKYNMYYCILYYLYMRIDKNNQRVQNDGILSFIVQFMVYLLNTHRLTINFQ